MIYDLDKLWFFKLVEINFSNTSANNNTSFLNNDYGNL